MNTSYNFPIGMKLQYARGGIIGDKGSEWIDCEVVGISTSDNPIVEFTLYKGFTFEARCIHEVDDFNKLRKRRIETLWYNRHFVAYGVPGSLSFSTSKEEIDSSNPPEGAEWLGPTFFLRVTKEID